MTNEELTYEQEQAIQTIASLRHNLHCNTDAAFYEEYSGSHLWDSLESTVYDIMEHAGLATPAIPFNELDERATDTDDYDNNHDRSLAKEETNELAEKINNILETWLRDIDVKYGTSYSPTGHARINRYERLAAQGLA